MLKPIVGLSKLHVTPLATVRVESPRVLVEVDDEHENRVCLVFEPYQALRVVTADCFSLPGGLEIIPQTVAEVLDSPWIENLKMTLKQIDFTAAFMDKARHFVIPAQDDFIEIVAWDVCEQKKVSD